MTPDKAEALETAIGLGFERVLTSGGRPGAPQGAELIAELIGQAGDRITIMPGAGLTTATSPTSCAARGQRRSMPPAARR